MNFLKLPRTTNVRVGSYNFPSIKLTLQVKNHLNTTENINSQAKAVTIIKRKENTKPYEAISRAFKKIKPPMFNGEIEKGEEEEAWLFRMKKYFQIYR